MARFSPVLLPEANAELLRLLARGISRSASAGNGWRRYTAAWREMPRDGSGDQADGPLAGVFWRVLNALDYSDAGEFVAGGRGCVDRAVVGG